jgi:hypothetical protein
MMVQSPERLTREHQTNFNEVFTSVSAISDIFEDDEIWPSQCDHAVTSIQYMSNLVKHLYEVTDMSSAYFSPNVDLHRNQLLIILRSLEKLLNYDLLPYIKVFRTLCRTASIQAIRQKELIRYKFELVQSNGENALNAIKMLLDQARFEDNRAAVN